MKKLFILLSVALCSLFVGCDKNDAGGVNRGGSDSIVGIWSCNLSDFGDPYTTLTWRFNRDGSFTYSAVENYNGEVSSYVEIGRYEYKTPVLTLYYEGEDEPEEMVVEIDGDVLYFEGVSWAFYRQ